MFYSVSSERRSLLDRSGSHGHLPLAACMAAADLTRAVHIIVPAHHTRSLQKDDFSSVHYFTNVHCTTTFSTCRSHPCWPALHAALPPGSGCLGSRAAAADRSRFGPAGSTSSRLDSTVLTSSGEHASSAGGPNRTHPRQAMRGVAGAHDDQLLRPGRKAATGQAAQAGPEEQQRMALGFGHVAHQHPKPLEHLRLMAG